MKYREEKFKIGTKVCVISDLTDIKDNWDAAVMPTLTIMAYKKLVTKEGISYSYMLSDDDFYSQYNICSALAGAEILKILKGDRKLK